MAFDRLEEIIRHQGPVAARSSYTVPALSTPSNITYTPCNRTPCLVSTNIPLFRSQLPALDSKTPHPQLRKLYAQRHSIIGGEKAASFYMNHALAFLVDDSTETTFKSPDCMCSNPLASSTRLTSHLYLSLDGRRGEYIMWDALEPITSPWLVMQLVVLTHSREHLRRATILLSSVDGIYWVLPSLIHSTCFRKC